MDNDQSYNNYVKDSQDTSLDFGSQSTAAPTQSLEFGSTPKTTIPDESVPIRAAKADFSLGGASPGRDTIAATLANGDDDRIRQLQLEKNGLDFQQAKLGIVHKMVQNSPEGVSPEEADLINNVSKQDYGQIANASNILETSYAKKYIQTLAAKDDAQSYAKSEALAPEVASQKLDVAEFAISRIEIAHTLLDDVQSQQKAQGWGGYLADVGASLLPLAAVRLENLVSQAPTTSLLPGANVQEQINYLHSLNPDAFHTQLKAALDSMPNLQLREQFATAVLQQGDSDTALSSLNTVADLATIGEIGVKGLVKVGEVLATREAAKASRGELDQALGSLLKGGVTANKDRSPDYAKLAGQTGDFKTNAVLNSIKQTMPEVTLSDEEMIRQKALSINGGSRAWYDGSAPNLARSQSEDFLKVTKGNEDLAHEFLDSDTVDRTSPQQRYAVREALFDRTIAGNNKGINGSVLDVDAHTGMPLEGRYEAQGSPPVAEGYTRYYTADKSSPTLTPDAPYASNFNEQLKAGKIHYVDIPDDLFKGTVMEKNPGEFEAPKNITDKLQPLTSVLDKPKFVRVTGGAKYIVKPAEESLANIETIGITLGRKDGSLFPNKASAVKFANDNLSQHILDLSGKDGSNLISVQGKWALRLYKDAPDTLDNIKDIAIPANDKFNTGFWNGLGLGKIRNQANVLGLANTTARHVVGHGNQRLFKVFQEMVKPIAALSKTERKRLGAILELNRDFVDRSTGSGDRGMFFQSRQDFEDTYRTKWGVLPSDRETIAYYSYVQANQLDGMVRNTGWLRDKVRLGLSSWTDRHSYPTPDDKVVSRKWSPINFEGRDVRALPDDGEHSLIAVRDSQSGEVRFFHRNGSNISKEGKDLIAKESAGGAKVIQHSEGSLEIKTPEGTRHVSHYVTATAKEGRISVNGPWKDGGHVINQHSYYVKQPIARGEYYAGDEAIATAPTEGIAKSRASAFETARIKMIRGDADLDQFVSANIGNGMTGKDFMEMFGGKRTVNGIERAGLDKNQPFLWTKSGEKTIDRHKTSLSVKENPYNLINLDRHFAGERDATNVPALIDEKGVAHIFEDGKLIDPYQSLTEAAKSMVDVWLKRDYILKSASQWSQQFADILEDASLKKGSLQTLFENGTQYKKAIDPILKRNAENARRQMLRFAGSLSKEDSIIEIAKQRMSDMVYNVVGDKNYQVLEPVFGKLTKNPLAALRSFAAQLHVGLFNPVQFLMQATTVGNVLAITPKAGLKGLAAYLPIRSVMFNPELMGHAIETAGKFGWKSEHFTEMYNSFVKSGWGTIAGDQSILDDISSPKVFRSGTQKAFDAGSIFFREGERVHRLTGYGAAYTEWRNTNPIAAYDRAAQQWVLNRADTLTAHMSAANNAMWQKGLLSIPAQFTNYHARMFESYWAGTGNQIKAAFTGTQATKGTLALDEKLRLFASQAVLWGFPTAVGGTVGVWPVFKSVKAYLIDHDIPHDDAAVETVLNGIPQAIVHSISGSNFDIGERFGAGGLDLGRELLRGEKSSWDLATGPVGSTLHDILSTAIPYLGALGEVGSDDPKGHLYPLDLETLTRVTENVSSINSAARMWFAMNTGRWMSKYDIQQTEVTPFQAVFMGLTGAQLTELNESFETSGILKDRKDLADQGAKTAAQYFRRGFDEEDPQQRIEYMKTGAAWAHASGMTDHEIMQLKKMVLQGSTETQVQQRARRLREDTEQRGLNK